jgi:glycosyltransferase involved in cell wall biosynthesis
MSVVFVNRFCHPDHSATSQILSDLAAGLASQGMTVAMVASRQHYDDPSAHLPAREFWRGVHIHRVWTSRFGRTRLVGRAIDYLTFYLSLPWVLWQLLRRGDVVVAKTDPPLVSMVVALVATLRGAVLINWLQDVFPEIAVSLRQPPFPRPIAWLLKKLRNRSLRAAAMNVAIGERMGEYFVAQGVAATRIQVIPNWAHEDAIEPRPSENCVLRRKLGLQNQFVVGYSGNLGRAHDWMTIFDAAQRLRNNSGIAFVIVGGGHGYDCLYARVAEARLANIHFQPYQPLDLLSDSMATANLHLVSLRPELEGQIVPSKFYGIAAAERAVGFIGDPDGELARLIAGADCGFSVPQGRGDLLAEAILRLAANLAECQSQGRRARQLLDDRFSRGAAHQQWHDLLRALASATQPSSNHLN